MNVYHDGWTTADLIAWRGVTVADRASWWRTLNEIQEGWNAQCPPPPRRPWWKHAWPAAFNVIATVSRFLV